MRPFLRIFSANSFGIVVAILGQVLSLPLFLHVWNKQLYGEWLVLTAVPNLLWSLEGGLGILASSRMTLASAAKDWKGANEIFHTTLVCQGLLSAVLYAGAIVVATTMHVATAYGFRIITNHEAAVILLLMMGYMLLGMTLSVYRAAYRASDREVWGALQFNTWRFIDLIVVVLVLSFHGNPVLLAFCMFTDILVWTGIVYLDVRRKCPCIIFGFTSISWMRMREMIIHGTPALMGQATIALYTQGYPLIVNRALGSAPVVTLTTLRAISRFGLLLTQTVCYTCSPLLSKSFGTRDWDFFRRLTKIMAVTAAWSGIGVTLLLTLLGPFIISTWTGGKLSVSHLTTFLFALSVSVQGIWLCFQITLNSCNRHHAFNYFYFFSTLLAGTLAYFLTRPFGFNAVPTVMLTSDLSIMLVGLYLSGNRVPESHPRELLCVFEPSFYRTHFSTRQRISKFFSKAQV